MQQINLFPVSGDPVIAPISARASDRPRLTGQNAAILARLQRGPATNVELASISLKYTSRVSDLRAAGYVVVCQFGAGGVNTYSLLAG